MVEQLCLRARERSKKDGFKTVIMLKPDARSSIIEGDGPLHDLFLGLGDWLAGKINPDFYRSKFGCNVTREILGKKAGRDSNRACYRELIIGFEELRIEAADIVPISLEELVVLTLSTAGFSLIDSKTKTLTNKDINQIYPRWLEPDYTFGESWKVEARERLKEEPVRFLVWQSSTGLGQDFLEAMKYFLRYTFRWREPRLGLVISRNIFHLPDENEKEDLFAFYENLH